MPNLQDILYKVELIAVTGFTDMEISSIGFDSRKVKPGSLFFAIKGTKVDGHHFIDHAIDNGASAILCEEIPPTISPGITYLKVKSSASALAQVAANFYDNPSEKLSLIGITGTNGKTTIATLLFHLFRKMGFSSGLISTIQYQADEEIFPSTHTTPDPVALNKLLKKMVDRGCQYCFMEVSSHAIVQKRIDALHFSGGVFTNLTHDHLDYHKTFKEYIEAKKAFFDALPSTAFALMNRDDKNAGIMVQNCKAKIKTYSLKMLADFRGQILENTFSGLLMRMDGQEIYSLLIGEFNAYNLMAIYGTAVLCGMNKTTCLKMISELKPAEGRFDLIHSKNEKISAIIDYAHTPDALFKVLSTIKQIRTGNEKVITLVGCGGDRDKTKRPEMARIAAENSNMVILTSDNPRSESPEAIIEDMKKGLTVSDKRKVLCITDRREAIRTACSIAIKGDIILVAGKGHEKYQEIDGVKLPFNDKQILIDTFNELDK